MKKSLHIDIETYSPTDLKSRGLYNYVGDPEFEILLLAHAFENQPVQLIDFTKKNSDTQKQIQDFLELYHNPEIQLIAHNAQFERICLGKKFAPVDPSRWKCTMAMCSNAGIELSLGLASFMLGGKSLKMIEDGKHCVRYFCSPQKARGTKFRNLPDHSDPTNPSTKLWDIFCAYCVSDVEAERDIFKRLSGLHVPEFEKALYSIDQKINDKGVRVDKAFTEKILLLIEDLSQDAMQAANQLGVENTKSAKQIVEFCTKHGVDAADAKKATVDRLIKSEDTPEDVKKVLTLRQSSNKSSLKKYQSILDFAGSDDRVRGLFQFGGAARTGRWAGRGVQVQNLPRNENPYLDIIRNFLGNPENRSVPSSSIFSMLQNEYGDVADLLSQLIRTAFVPEKGKKFVVLDFSAIEARVLSWLAGEKWRLDVFSSHGLIYEASASMMFGVPIEAVDKKTAVGSELRQKGKVAELALGYQGGVGALKAMGAEKMKLSEDAMKDIVAKWRTANPAIVQFWADIEKTAIEVITKADPNAPLKQVGAHVKMGYVSGFFQIHLPSGRILSYFRPNVLTTPSELPDFAQLYETVKNAGITTVKQLGEALAKPISKQPYFFGRASANNYNFRSLAKIYAQMEGFRHNFGNYPRTITYSECTATAVPQHAEASTYAGKLVENITQAVARDCLAYALAEMSKIEKLGLPVMHIHDELVFEVSNENATPEFYQFVQRKMAEPISWAKDLPLGASGFIGDFYKKD